METMDVSHDANTIFIHACLEQKIGSPPCYMLYNTVWVHTRGGYESMRRTSLGTAR